MKLPDPEDLGPKMQALHSHGQRAFVWNMLLNGGNAKAAYMDAFPNAGPDSANVSGWRLKHTPAIIEAMHEAAGLAMHATALPAMLALVSIISDPTHKDRYKAADAILSRTGFPVTTHTITERRGQSDKEIRAEITRIAQDMGIDPRKFLGNVIEATALVEVTADDEPLLDDEDHSTEGLEDIL